MEVVVPIEIVYDTEMGTPIADVVAALKASESLIESAVSLLPSLISDADISLRSLGVRRLSQNSPLKELLVATLVVSLQDKLTLGVTTGLKDVAGIDVPTEYQALVTVAVLVVVFFGVRLANDTISRAMRDGPSRKILTRLVADIAGKTGKTEQEVMRIIEAKYSKPGAVRALISAALDFFRPSHREGATAVDVGAVRLSKEVVADVPLNGQIDIDHDLERFDVQNNVVLEIHAQDRDKATSGWAAVVPSVSTKRLRMKVVAPLEPSDLWGKSAIHGDIVLVSRLTAEGFEPCEVHLTGVVGRD